MRKFFRFGKLAAVLIAALIAFFGFYGSSRKSSVHANSSGPPPTFTGAPNEDTCTVCHSDFALNSGEGNVRITGLPTRYTASQQIPVTITVNHNNGVVFGFQTTAVGRSGGTAGNYVLPTQNPPQMQIVNGIISTGIERRYVEHTLSGIIPTQFNTKSWTFTWQAPTALQGPVAFHATGNGANSDNSTSGDYIYKTAHCVYSFGGARSNFDADAKTDIAVFRPSNGLWYRLNSTDGAFVATQFGATGDKIVPGDFDGDGKTDTAVYRTSNNTWYIYRSSLIGTPNDPFLAVQFGASGDIPLVGDFTGDNRSELVIFRPSNGVWYTWNLVNNGFSATQFGAAGDKPVSADFDGDGKNDFAVFRPSNGIWYYLRSSNNQFSGVQFGSTEDKPVPADFDGDGLTDFAVFRPSNGTWYIQQSAAGFRAVQFGASGDQPAPADYDSDCRTDIAVFRNGNWFIQNSSDNSFRSVAFGSSGDVAVPFAFTAE